MYNKRNVSKYNVIERTAANEWLTMFFLVHFLSAGNSKWSRLLLVAASCSANRPSVPALCAVNDQPQRPPGEDPAHPHISAEHPQQLRSSPLQTSFGALDVTLRKPSFSISTNYSLYYQWLFLFLFFSFYSFRTPHLLFCIQITQKFSEKPSKVWINKADTWSNHLRDALFAIK